MKTSSRLSYRNLLSYGILGLPMAFVGLPIYVYMPQYYAKELGIPLATLSLLLLLARLIDTVQDPFIGYASDRFQSRGINRSRLMRYAAPLLAIGFATVFLPPFTEGMSLKLFLFFALILTYTAFSVIEINLHSRAAEITTDYHDQSRLTTTREGAGLIGVLLATVLPTVLTLQLGSARAAYEWLVALFVVLLFLPLWIHTRYSPQGVAQENEQKPSLKDSLLLIKTQPLFRRFALIALLNGIAASIPASVLLFYVDDVLKTPSYTALYLTTYFLAGALGMPFWLWCSKQYGKRVTWLVSMITSIIAFGWAFSFEEGQWIAFTVVCLLSGLSFGADKGLPPSLLADLMHDRKQAGSYFGIMSLVSKLSLTLAGSMSLYALDLTGYIPGEGSSHTESMLFGLAAIYALLPCAFKAFAAFLLWKSPIDIRYKENLS